ncbi:hypothetical protein NKH77_55660 [Streptomyces sp. M19]
MLVTANHGDFDHVEHVVRAADGGWRPEYLYDDSTVLLFGLESDGRLAALRDVRVMEGHGRDPNSSPQAGGHGQAGAHAHCAVIAPSVTGSWSATRAPTASWSTGWVTTPSNSSTPTNCRRRPGPGTSPSHPAATAPTSPASSPPRSPPTPSTRPRARCGR